MSTYKNYYNEFEFGFLNETSARSQDLETIESTLGIQVSNSDFLSVYEELLNMNVVDLAEHEYTLGVMLDVGSINNDPMFSEDYAKNIMYMIYRDKWDEIEDQLDDYEITEEESTGFEDKVQAIMRDNPDIDRESAERITGAQVKDKE